MDAYAFIFFRKSHKDWNLSKKGIDIWTQLSICSYIDCMSMCEFTIFSN